MSDPLTDAANAISDASPKIKAFAQLAAQRIIALEHPAPTPTPTPTPAPARWFADSAYINKPVPDNPVKHASSDTWIKQLLAGVGSQLATNVEPWSTTVYTATASTPARMIALQVPFDGGPYKLSLPMDPSWKASAGDDHMAVILGTRYWEFQGLDVATATALACAWGDLTGNAQNTPTNRVSVLPTVAGLILPSEVDAGVIPHALRVCIPTASPQFVPPACVSDGHTAGGMPSGSHIILPRSVSLAGLNPWQTLIARALQTYGAYVGDSGGAFACYAESTADGSSYPFAWSALPSSFVAQLVVLA